MPSGQFFSPMLLCVQILNVLAQPTDGSSQGLRSTAAGLGLKAPSGACYLICSQIFARRKARQPSVVSLEELSSFTETSLNNILSLCLPPSLA